MPAVLSPLLTLRFTKVSDDRHRLSLTRADGSGETVELETRSFLTHDFLHIAVETEAKLRRGVFGTLAGGATYDELAATDMSIAVTEQTRELREVEMIVGPLTSVVQGKTSAAVFLLTQRAQRDSVNAPLPEWVTEAFVSGAEERYRKLMGQWKATAFGETMEVQFAP